VLSRVSDDGGAAGAASAASAAGSWSAQQLLATDPAITAATQYKDYSFNATFNSKNGRFDGMGDQGYFERNAIPPDKDGRQMSHFFDLGSLDANRAEYLQKKKYVAAARARATEYRCVCILAAEPFCLYRYCCILPCVRRERQNMKGVDWKKYKEKAKKKKDKKRNAWLFED
jgi:hypothetical protein